MDWLGKPLGTDFISFWTAARMPAGQLYSIPAHYAAQKALFPVKEYTAFFYPPVFALYCKALAAPYFVALGLFLTATCAAYWFALSKWLGRHALLFVVAFPTFFLTVGHGQTSFLSAALLGGGAYLLPKRPALAGLLFGLLVFKPQLGLLVPVLLIAGRHWRAFGSATLTVILLAGLSTLVFGASVWADWLASAQIGRTFMENGAIGFHKMQTVFAGVRLVGGSVPLAYGLQTVTFCAVAGLIALVSWRQPYSLGTGAAMIAAIPLTTPFFLDYDLTLLAFPIAYLAGRPKLPWDKVIIGLTFAWPIFSRPFAETTSINITPVAVALLLWAVVRQLSTQTK